MRRRTVGFVSLGPVLRLGVVTFAALLCLPGSQLPLAVAGEGEPVVRVEEDWQLVLNEPGSEVNAPQFHTLLSPCGHTQSVYAQFSWNYRELPDFVSGGLQVQAWHGEHNLYVKSVGEEPLSRNAETITWTQRLEAAGCHLRFKVVNGQSSSWGPFGGEEMSVLVPASFADLNQYSTAVSKSSSWVTYGSNRVNSLVITEVRRYGVSGLLSRDTTPVVVFRLSHGD